jgi:hypothetical protein
MFINYFRRVKMDEKTRKADLIEQILDKVKPIPADASEQERQEIVDHRKKLIVFADLENKSIAELEQKLAKQSIAARKFEIIELMLDRIKPIPANAAEDVQDAIDTERQMLVLRTRWNKMSVEQLEAVLAGKA